MRVWKLLLWACIAIVLVLTIALFFLPRAEAATNISSVLNEQVAWNDIVGWINFYTSDTVSVLHDKLTGYAVTTTLGEISLDCATTPIGNMCGLSNYGVVNDFAGHLSGYAWNDTIGWISMSCLNDDTCSTANYEVTIDPTNGNFNGWAWNDSVGWISFNGCPSSCGLYKVKTSWVAVGDVGYLESSAFDTKITGGATLNSIVWLGNDPGGDSRVDFQIAVSNNSIGPWTWIGSDGTEDTYYGASCDATFVGGEERALPNTPVCINPNHVKNMRYLRYRVRIQTNSARTASPIIEDIILNWSR